MNSCLPRSVLCLVEHKSVLNGKTLKLCLRDTYCLEMQHCVVDERATKPDQPDKYFSKTLSGRLKFQKQEWLVCFEHAWATADRPI